MRSPPDVTADSRYSTLLRRGRVLVHLIVDGNGTILGSLCQHV